MVRKVPPFSCRKRGFRSYGYGEEPERGTLKAQPPEGI